MRTRRIVRGQEGCPELGFELMDRLGKRRLSDAKAFGGVTEGSGRRVGASDAAHNLLRSLARYCAARLGLPATAS